MVWESYVLEILNVCSLEQDFSDLEEKVDYVLSNFNTLNEQINDNIRKKFVKEYDYEKLCLYYYNIFRNLDEIGES